MHGNSIYVTAIEKNMPVALDYRDYLTAQNLDFVLCSVEMIMVR